MDEIIEKSTESEQSEEIMGSGTVAYIDSREVAKMVEKDHTKLLRDVRRYERQLNEAKIGSVDLWVESEYEDGKGEVRPCYRVTKKGCEFIAHKLTGTKGAAFTARYIERFHEMESALRGGEGGSALMVEFIRQQTQFNAEMARINAEILNRLSGIELRGLPDRKAASNPFGLSREDASEEMKALNEKIARVCEAYNLEWNKCLHFLYVTIEEKMDVSVNSYLAVYRAETGDTEASAIHAIAKYPALNRKANELLDNAIKRSKVFG